MGPGTCRTSVVSMYGRMEVSVRYVRGPGACMASDRKLPELRSAHSAAGRDSCGTARWGRVLWNVNYDVVDTL